MADPRRMFRVGVRASRPPVGEDQPAASGNNDAAAGLEAKFRRLLSRFSPLTRKFRLRRRSFGRNRRGRLPQLREQYGRIAGYPVGPDGFSAESRAFDDLCSRPRQTRSTSRGSKMHGAPQGLSLFAPNPLDLLTESDREVLEHLRVLQREGSVTIAGTYLEEYLSTMGWHVFELANRAEEVLRTSRAMLARDPKVVVALLATCRLVERGELGVGEAARVLEQTLQQLVGGAGPAADLSISQSSPAGTESWLVGAAASMPRELGHSLPGRRRNTGRLRARRAAGSARKYPAGKAVLGRIRRRSSPQ